MRGEHLLGSNTCAARRTRGVNQSLGSRTHRPEGEELSLIEGEASGLNQTVSWMWLAVTYIAPSGPSEKVSRPAQAIVSEDGLDAIAGQARDGVVAG